jgi:hypothetical protein
MFQFPTDRADLPAGRQVVADKINMISVYLRNQRETVFLFQKQLTLEC